MELIINTNLETELPATIDFNFEQLKGDLSQALEKYDGVVVTEETLAAAKKDRAKLNNLKKAINDKRISIKNACLSPYNEFEGRVKELVAMIEQSSSAIDTQIKAMEQAERDEKRRAIEHFYQTNIGSLMGLVSLEKILHPKWANKGMELIAVNQDMAEKIALIKNDIERLRDLRLPYIDQVVGKYLETLDYRSALEEVKRLELQEKALQKLEQEKRAQAAAAPPVYIAPAIPHKILGITREPEEDIQAYDFRCFMTAEQKAIVRECFIANNIRYTRVPIDSEGRIVQWQSKTA